MNIHHSAAAVAVYKTHEQAEAAVKELQSLAFNMKNLSIVARDFQTDQHVVGYYNTGNRMRSWGATGAFWGGIWSLFFGGVFLTIPVIGPVMVLGHLAAMVVAAVEGAILVGGVSALGAALFSIGIPKDSVIQYEQAVKTDGFLVVAHGSADEMARSKTILESNNPTRIDLHEDLKSQGSAHQHAPA